MLQPIAFSNVTLHQLSIRINMTMMISRHRKIFQEFLVKYAHKSAQKLTKIHKNVVKYALNMLKIILNKMHSF